MSDHSLAELVRQLFGRKIWWCWETLIEELAVARNIPLDADRLTYAGGTLRTGPYTFRRNDANWRSLCNRIQTDSELVSQVIDQAESALRSPHAVGVAYSWRRRMDSRILNDGSKHAVYADRLLQWTGDVYRSRSDASRIIDAEKSVLYGLWRLDHLENPIQPFPLYVGEAGGTARTRIDGAKGHRHWWGDGKPIGVTVAPILLDKRLKVEEHVIRFLIPFCNAKGRDLGSAWDFPRPVYSLSDRLDD